MNIIRDPRALLVLDWKAGCNVFLDALTTRDIVCAVYKQTRCCIANINTLGNLQSLVNE